RPCRRVLILNHGRVVAHGTVAEIARQAAAPRTATIRIAGEDAERARAALSPLHVEAAGATLRVSLDGARPNEPLRRLVDAGIGECERRTLESLLLTPVSLVALVTGKLLGALSLWLAAFATTIAYVWFLGRGVGIAGDALASGIVVGTLFAVFLGSLGILI